MKNIDEEGYVFIHDGARPMLNADIIRRLQEVVTQDGTAVAGMPVKDTINIVDEASYIKSVPERKYVWQVQTPQCFKRDVILMCHKNALYDNFEATDDCMIAENYGVAVKLIEASTSNIKVTNYKDLAVTEVLLNV